ncbi:NAD(P)H-hydrate dehydratase [Massilia sp. erpn]|uniref:NAD(P)H-hydrate dehydratase n=1 Tax=Massilia sp. erpn TaxID=2738142 RepID=UPI0021056854|nr:NAD(P)H-hydrate dehydratase [Massilia sp. erpn]UTY59370.1 NAD(P)H-hydrate dehydratase [Massilia sp. erpn]
MNPLYSVAEIRQIEAAGAALLPAGALMQRAGQAAANAALDLLPFSTSRARVLVLAGPGNNGGDALEAAAHLSHAGAQVAIRYFDSPRPPSPERAHALERARSSPARFVELQPEDIAAAEWNLVVDGLFGIGLQRTLDGAARELVLAVNALGCPVLALDVPSGLDADSGCIVGDADGVAIRASHTVTFLGDKAGLHTCAGRDHAGLVSVNRLEVDEAVFPPASMHLNDVTFFGRNARTRSHNSHKGSFGNVAVIGGAHGMGGAPVLAGRAALMSGAGRVYLGFAADTPVYDSAHPELMCRNAADISLDDAVLVVGPGLGTAPAARTLLLRAIGSAQVLLADADALNLLAASPELKERIARRAAPTVLTPHPLEAARLLGISAAEIQRDRIGHARALAVQLQAYVVLKGSGSVIAAPDGRIVINTTGNPALATAGTGDVLAGLCGSLLAQGWPAWEAALAAVWLHGMAADVLVADGSGPIGITASELLPAIRVAHNRMVHHHGR